MIKISLIKRRILKELYTSYEKVQKLRNEVDGMLAPESDINLTLDSLEYRSKSEERDAEVLWFEIIGNAAINHGLLSALDIDPFIEESVTGDRLAIMLDYYKRTQNEETVSKLRD